MENSIYIGLSRQTALKNNLDIIANNIANANTPGFRAQNLLFKEFLSDPRGNREAMSFVNDIGEYKNTEAGAVQYTGNPMDVALSGPGFLGVNGPNGQIAYTRAGAFELRADGTIITPGGDVVAGQGSGPIVVPPNSKEIKIDNRGFVSTENGQIGQLMIVEFENPQSLRPIGNNLYVTDDPAPPAQNTTVRQGMLEGSNVKPVIEMTRMIDTLRSFQATQQVLQTENDRMRSAIQKLTRG